MSNRVISNVRPRYYPTTVCVRIVTRSYGGPEEGGWYYDSNISYEGHTKVNDEYEFDKVVAELCEEYSLKTYPGSGRTPCRWRDGTDYAIHFGSAPTHNESFPRPQYC